MNALDKQYFYESKLIVFCRVSFFGSNIIIHNCIHVFESSGDYRKLDLLQKEAPYTHFKHVNSIYSNK